mmetsp:Transcript_22915/g.53083  ORF Transcript_22915/g.53083 Transcript_22915/m.53083 type:complete len:316 (-) Transcript_22915:1059-2006(-)
MSYMLCVLLQDIVNALSEEELELCAQSSFAYWRSTLTKSSSGEKSTATMIMAMREARRYLMGARGDKDMALEYLKKTCRYRQETRLDLLRSCFSTQEENNHEQNQEDVDMVAHLQSMILQDTAHQTVVVQGFDKSHCAVLHLGNRTCAKMSNEAFLKTQLYMVERALATTEARSLGRQEQMVVFLDAGCIQSKCAPSLQTVKELVSILQKHYPQRLKSLVVLDPPFWLRTMYTMLSPFLDSRTRQKFQLASGEKEQKKIFQEILMDTSTASIDDIDMKHFLTKVPFSQGYIHEVAPERESPPLATAGQPQALLAQ